MTISKAIIEATKKFPFGVKYCTEVICNEWAKFVASKIPGAKATWDCDIDPAQQHLRYGQRDANHCFVSYKGKYYDAACHEGVDNWRDLPFFQHRQYLLL